MFGKNTTANPLRDFDFASLASDEELDRLDRLTTMIDMPEGRVLMREGSFGNEVLLLVAGELLVERDGEAVAVIRPGNVVGEQAVILNAPRNATVRAATDVTILAMTRAEFNSVLDECPSVARNILEEALHRSSK